MINVIGSKNGDGAEWNSIPMLKCDPSTWDVYTVIDYGDPEIMRPGTKKGESLPLDSNR